MASGQSPRPAMLRDAIGVRNEVLAVEEAGACMLVVLAGVVVLLSTALVLLHRASVQMRARV